MTRHKDYSGWMPFRFFLLVCLWAYYALIPHILPESALLVVTVVLAGYAGWVFTRRQDYLNGSLIVLAAILNTLLITMLESRLNTILTTIAIFAILLFDLATSPNKPIILKEKQ